MAWQAGGWAKQLRQHAGMQACVQAGLCGAPELGLHAHGAGLPARRVHHTHESAAQVSGLV